MKASFFVFCYVFLVFLCLAKLAKTQTYVYNVTVSMSVKRFDDVDGRLKMTFIGAGFEYDTVLSAKKETFRYGMIKNYAVFLNGPYDLDRIQRVRLRFTLKGSSLFNFRSRYVLVDRVEVGSMNVQDIYHRFPSVKRFCPSKPNVKLQHNTPYVFQVCY